MFLPNTRTEYESELLQRTGEKILCYWESTSWRFIYKGGSKRKKKLSGIN